MTAEDFIRSKSPFMQTWLRLRGRDKWLSTVATIYSCEYFERGRYRLPAFKTTYTYKMKSEIYVGQFFHDAEDIPGFRKDDEIEVFYNPRAPRESMAAEVSPFRPSLIVVLGVVLALAVTVILIQSK